MSLCREFCGGRPRPLKLMVSVVPQVRLVPAHSSAELVQAPAFQALEFHACAFEIQIL